VLIRPAANRRAGFGHPLQVRGAGSNNFDWVPVWIEQLNLLAAGAGDNIAAKLQAPVLHGGDHRRQVLHRYHEAIPSTRFWLLAIWQRASAGTAWTAQKHVSAAARHVCEGSALLMLQLETELLRVELDGAVQVARLIPDSVNSKRRHGHAASSNGLSCGARSIDRCAPQAKVEGLPRHQHAGAATVV
jgi:hypothetical protein